MTDIYLVVLMYVWLGLINSVLFADGATTEMQMACIFAWPILFPVLAYTSLVQFIQGR